LTGGQKSSIIYGKKAALPCRSVVDFGSMHNILNGTSSAIPRRGGPAAMPSDVVGHEQLREKEEMMTDQGSGDSKLLALLIGVDCYMPNRLPDGGRYTSLGGCVRDITHVEEFLKQRLGLADERILKLTASNGGEAEPTEPKEQWPTYANMVAAFKRLTDMAQEGDQVYIHYSGHGGRAATAFPELKGDQALDEALVPTDVGMEAPRYLRDVELAHLLKAMVDKGLVVTVVLDSCHSGGATRGEGGAVARGILSIDTRPPPQGWHSLVASHDELVQTWQELSEGGTRAVKPAAGWLLEPKGYVLLAACRASESAYEYAFDGENRNGALTYWMLDSLQELGPGLSYKMLHDRILAKVHTQFERQTPQLQGEPDRAVFGSERVQPQYHVPVMDVDKKRVLLNAGQAQGLRKGSQFAIYPHGTVDFGQVDQRLALVEVADLGAVDSWARVTERLRDEPIEQGAQAVLLEPGTVRLQRTMRLTRQPEDVVPAQVDQAAALQAVEDALAASGQGWVLLATGRKPADFQVAVNAEGEYEIWDAAGAELPNLRPALGIDDAQAPAQVVQRLVHLAKYRNVLELRNNDTLSPLARKLKVELTGVQEDYDPVDPPEPGSFEDAGHTPTIEVSQWTFLRVRNNMPPGRRNDPSRILNVTVLDLQPDWGISQIYPGGAGFFEPLDPGQEIVLPLQASLPDGYSEGVDVIKVFATLGTANFRWLELPALDQPTRSAGERGLPQSPLEELLAAVAAEEPSMRQLNPAAFPSREWVTEQVEVRISR
jgi:hypothetical protein